MKETIKVTLTQEDIEAAMISYVAQKYGTFDNHHVSVTVTRDEHGWSMKASVTGEVDVRD